MMKKMLFLMLFLLTLGAAKVNAQVRIGGNSQPQGAAVLDLNADNSATPVQKGGLALPRVNLADRAAYLNGTKPVNGTLVYNTNTSLGVGVCYFQDSIWIRVTPGTAGIIPSTDTLTFMTSPPTVTWSLVLDTVLTVKPVPYGNLLVPLRGYSQPAVARLFCRLYDYPAAVISYETATRSLRIWWNTTYQMVGPDGRLRCYQASI